MKIKCQDTFVVRFNPAILDFIEGKTSELGVPIHAAVISSYSAYYVLAQVNKTLRDVDRMLTGKAEQ
jgi:hypothetical protein